MGEENAFWRSIINSYKGEFPEEGAKAPPMENISSSNLKDGESPVVLQKIITEIYVYTSIGSNEIWGQVQSFQDVQVLGSMRLSEALKIIEGAKKRRRRR